MRQNDIPLSSVVSYPERGIGGSNRYRGNCSPKLIEDLLCFYKPSMVCDYMVGSGTTFDAAAACGIPCFGYDLRLGFDLLNCEIPERSQFTFWHPPYHDIIQYSDAQYSAAAVQRQYGIDPAKADLSRIKSWDDFVKAMNYCMMKQFAALEKGGRIAVLMGDIKKKGQLYSMLAQIVKPGTLEQILVKTQHNCVSDRHAYQGKRFIPIVHEYVMIVRKDRSLVFPVLLTNTVAVDTRDIRSSSWRDVLLEVMEQRKGDWSLHDLYKEIEGHEKAVRNSHWQEKIRQTLQRYPSTFRKTGNGKWSLTAA